MLDKNNNKYFYIILLIISCLIGNFKNDYFSIGFVDLKNDNYIIVNKLLYKCKVYNTSFDVGDIVVTSQSKTNNSESDLKNNILYTSNLASRVGKNILKSKIYLYIIDKQKSNIYLNIFYNIFDDELSSQFDFLSLSISFYYFILLFFNKKSKIGLILIVLYSILFGFQIKFFLLIIDFFLFYIDIDKIEFLFSKVLLICLINKYLLLNYSFLLSMLISFSLSFNQKYKLSVIAFIQSMLFGEVKIFNILFFKAYIFEKISIFIFGIISLLFNTFEIFFINYLDLLNTIFKFLSFSIRGQIGFIALFLYFAITRLFRVKNNIFRYLILVIILLLPFKSIIPFVDFIDVGQGDSILISDSLSNEYILIDTGSRYNYSKLKKELFCKGIYKLDYLIITHDDSDHNDNIDNLKNDFIINNIIKEGQDIHTKNLFLKYLQLPDVDNDNDRSLVYLLKIDGYNFLFTGDISSKIENNIIFNHNINDIDVLKVSHHGSNTATSNYFVGSIKPEFAVISTSGKYKHPHKEVIDVLDKYLVRTFITKNDGNVIFYFTKLFDYIVTSKNGFDIIIK